MPTLRSRWLSVVVFLGAFACKEVAPPGPPPHLPYGGSNTIETSSNWAGNPRTDLFDSCRTPKERWERFRAKIQSPGSDSELVAVFASVLAPGRSAIPFGEGDWYQRWSDLARSSKDLRVRSRFALVEPMVHQGDSTETNFFLSKLQVLPGDVLEMEGRERRIRLERTRMRFGAGVHLEATAQTDTLWVENVDGTGARFSKPMLPGLWRLTLLEPTEFMERFVSIAPRSLVAFLEDGKLHVLAEQPSKVHVSADGARWKTFRTDSAGILTVGSDSLGMDTARRVLNLLVEDSGQILFDNLLALPPRGTDQLLGAAWADRERVVVPGGLSIQGFVTSFDGAAFTHRRKGADTFGFFASGGGDGFGPIPDIVPGKDGHFQIPLGLSTTTSAGRVSLELVRKPASSGKESSATNLEVPMGIPLQVTRPLEELIRTATPRYGDRQPVIRLCSDRTAFLTGDTATLRIEGLSGDGKPMRSRVRMELLVDKRHQRDSVLDLDRAGTSIWKIPVDTSGVFQVRASEEAGGRKAEREYEFSAFRPQDIPGFDAGFRVSWEGASIREGVPLRLRFQSRWEGAKVFAFLAGRGIGEIGTGRIVEGASTLVLPAVSMGIETRLIAVLMGPRGKALLDTVLPVFGKGSLASVQTKVVGNGAAREVSFSVLDPSGRPIAGKVSVRVSNRPWQRLAWGKAVGQFEGERLDYTQGFVPPWLFEAWSDQTRNSTAWKWLGIGPPSEGRRLKPPRHPLPAGMQPGVQRPVPHPREFSMPKFGYCGEPFFQDAHTAATRVVHWQARVETQLSRPTTFRVVLPPADGPWTLEVRGTAGDHLLVEHSERL